MPPANNASETSAIVSPIDNAINRVDLRVERWEIAAEPPYPEDALHDRFITLHLGQANYEYSSYSGESNEDDDEVDYDDDSSDDNYFQDDDMPMVLDYDPLYDDMPPLGPL